MTRTATASRHSRAAGRLSALALAACLLASTFTYGQEVHQHDSGARAAPGPIVVYSDVARWMPDDEFVHGPRLLDFDLTAYLQRTAPHLLPFTEFVAHWCAYYSISPEVLLTVIEMRSGLVSRRAGLADVNDPVAGLVAGQDFREQVRNTLAALYADFYAFRAAARGDDINAATYALLNLFRGPAAPAAFAASAPALRQEFEDTHRRLFAGRTVAAAAGGGELVIPAAPPSDLLQLPWTNGQSWFFGGVHTTDGSNVGPMSSLDFYRGGEPWGSDTSTAYVVAAHSGTATVFSSCFVRVTSPSGWATNYYHLDGVQVFSGQQVSANQRLAVYANTLAQATCQGGSSTGPHVHFSLLQNGAFTSIDGASLSGYVVHAGRYSYDIDPAFMWMTRDGVRYFVGTRLLSSPTFVSTRIIGVSGDLAFGSVTVGTTATRTMTIANTGNSPMSVSGITYPAGFSGAWSGTVAAGGSQSVTVTFAPSAVGSYGGTVTVHANHTAGTNTLAASGTGIPAATRIIGLSGNLAFGSLEAGTAAHAVLTISNTGTAPLTVFSILYPAGFSGPWAGAIAAGASQQVTVTFVPPTAGAYGGPVTVNANETSGADTINAAGTGTASTLPQASYSTAYHVPVCPGFGLGCDSGAALLLGAGSRGPELNAPNTLRSSCSDGAFGGFHVDESVDRIRVSTLDGTPLAPGKQVRIDVLVWAWSADDRLDVYHTAHARVPAASWTTVATDVAPARAGQQMLTTTYTLPTGGLQAFRARFRYLGSAAVCTGGTEHFDDHDDLAFTVHPVPFAEPALIPGTSIRASHVIELRERIQAARAIYGLTPFVWAESAVTARVTVVRASHMAEMWAALDQVYAVAGLAAPARVVPTAGSFIAAAHITQLRTAVNAIE